MYNSRRSGSESDSLKRSVHSLTAPNRRSTTFANVNRDSIYYSANVSETPPINRTISTPACNAKDASIY